MRRSVCYPLQQQPTDACPDSWSSRTNKRLQVTSKGRGTRSILCRMDTPAGRRGHAQRRSSLRIALVSSIIEWVIKTFGNHPQALWYNHTPKFCSSPILKCLIPAAFLTKLLFWSKKENKTPRQTDFCWQTPLSQGSDASQAQVRLHKPQARLQILAACLHHKPYFTYNKDRHKSQLHAD